MSREATLKEIMAYLDMPATTFLKKWRELPEADKVWFKVQVGIELATE